MEIQWDKCSTDQLFKMTIEGKNFEIRIKAFYKFLERKEFTHRFTYLAEIVSDCPTKIIYIKAFEQILLEFNPNLEEHIGGLDFLVFCGRTNNIKYQSLKKLIEIDAPIKKTLESIIKDIDENKKLRKLAKSKIDTAKDEYDIDKFLK